MPRRPRSTDDDVSLFPFLSIIACVIGVLTMMIATLTLAQTSNPDVEQIEEYEQAEKKLQKVEARIEQLSQQLSVSKSVVLEARNHQQVLDTTATELEELLVKLEEIERELAEQQQVKIVIPPVDPTMRETASDMQQEYDSLAKLLTKLEQELAKRVDSSEAQLTVMPQGSGASFQPHFVECTDVAIVLHGLPEPKRIRAADIAKDPIFLKLLETVANGKDDSIIFLIRSDGLPTFQACKRLCDEREIRNGKIPLVGKGRVDLTAFSDLDK